MRRARPLLRRLVPMAATAVALAPAPAHADQTVARTARPTGLAAGQGLLAFSAYDPAVAGYRLMISRDGAVRPAAVAPNPTPFDVDVGPTESGHPYLVYSRCEDRSSPVPRGCDIYAYDPTTGRENRYEASTRSHSEVHPTYWRGRIAFGASCGSAAAP
jgi:hypothetical protein